MSFIEKALRVILGMPILTIGIIGVIGKLMFEPNPNEPNLFDGLKHMPQYPFIIMIIVGYLLVAPIWKKDD